MDRLRSELNLTTQNLNSQINTITQNHGTLATEMSILSQTIQTLTDKLTSPNLINPLIQNQQNTPTQNSPTQNNTLLEFSLFKGEPEAQPVNNDEGRGNWRSWKLDLPVFYGEEPDGWILQAERYFTFYSLSEKEKVESAVVSLEGAALQWYH